MIVEYMLIEHFEGSWRATAFDPEGHQLAFATAKRRHTSYIALLDELRSIDADAGAEAARPGAPQVPSP